MDPAGYFDHNATTPLCIEARAAWCDAVDTHWLNPSSPYRSAARVNVRLEAARESLAGLFGVVSSRIVFNSGATEANNSVFAQWANTYPENAAVGVSPTEHPSVIEAAKFYFGGRVIWLALDGNGVVDLEALAGQLKAGELSAVSVMAANNETGVLNPWQEIAALCNEARIDYHCDASQWIGKLPLEGLSRCDYVSGCAHKFGGPRAAGFLVLPQERRAFSIFKGGAQEAGRRAGTEDVAGVLSMVAALESTQRQAVVASSTARDMFIVELRERLPVVQLIAETAPRLWNTLALIMPEFASERWIRGLEKRGFLVSAGAACAAGKAGPSHVLSAMRIDGAAMRRVLRISSGVTTRPSEWQALGEALMFTYEALRGDAEATPSKVISI